jgi:hypothetical protein
MKVFESKQLKANYRQALKKERYVNTEDVKKHRRRWRENTQGTEYYELNNTRTLEH